MSTVSIRYRIYPTEEQKHQMNLILGCNRFIWNWGINKIVEYYLYTGKFLSGYDLCNRLTWEKNNYEEMKWLHDRMYDVVATQQLLIKLKNSVNMFFKKLNKFPKYKDMTKEDIEEIKSKLYKRKKYGSYNTELNFKQIDDSNTINIAKLKFTKAKITLDESHIEKFKSCKISHTKSDRYYITIPYEKKDLSIREVKSKDDIIGIDIGNKTFATLSNGDKIDFPDNIFDKRFYKRLAHAQRVLSRKQKGSMNYEKQCERIARLWERECNRRDDWMHRQTKYLTTTYSEIHIENHPFYQGGKFMTREQRKKAIDRAFGEFFRQLEYKSKLYGSTLIRMEEDYPSSQLCSTCGYRNHEVKTKGLREWDCPICGSHHDRDINAAINIANHCPTTNVA